MRYFVALNIKDTEAYRSINARLVYLHMCCCMDYNTRECQISSRALADELGISHKAVRCALDVLLTARLIRAQVGAHARAQANTYIISSFANVEGTSEGTLEDTQFNNNNIKFSLADARARFFSERYKEKAAEYWGFELIDTSNWCAAFLDVQEARQRKGWTDEGDAWRHMLDWVEKHKKKIRTRGAEVAAPQEHTEEPREDEYQGPIPDGWSSSDWIGIQKLVKSGRAAPGVKKMYEAGLFSLRSDQRSSEKDSD